MKKIKLLILLPFKTILLQIIVAVFLLILIFITSALSYQSLGIDDYYNVHIDENELFITNMPDENTFEEDGFEKIFSLVDGKVESERVEVEVNPLYTDINIEISNALQENISDYYTNGEVFPNIYPMYSSHHVTEKSMPNPIYNIAYIIDGQYPQSENDILVGEYYAIAYISDMNLNSYHELIGKSIIITDNYDKNSYELTVSGIAAGSNAFFVNPNNTLVADLIYKPNNYSFFKEFDTKEDKNTYISNLGGSTGYYDSSYNANNFHLYFKMSTFFISLIIFYFIIKISMRKTMIILNFYNKKYINTLVYLIPIILYIILITLFFSIF